MMYSTNGRIKQTKETANTKQRKVVVICLDCGFEDDTNSKVFGEVLKCNKCASENVDLR